MSKKTAGAKYFWGLGRRKSAIASIKLYLGKGDSLVNQRPLAKYFTALPSFAPPRYLDPFNATDFKNKYHFSAKIIGGGWQGQLQALSLALSRALVKVNAEHQKPLRLAGLLTVDSRVRQRRMIGTGGKARRQKQSPKR
jgi:small subunit ribosomal protein S9